MIWPAWAYKALAALAVVLAFAGLYAWGREGHQNAASEAAKAQVIATQRDTALSALSAFKAAEAANAKITQARIAVAQKQQKAAEARARNLDAALKAATDWSAAPIPDGVLGALDDPAAPEAAPADRAAARPP